MVMMACGPYTPSESLTYDPLIDLITIINKDRPNVCILVSIYIYLKSVTDFKDILIVYLNLKFLTSN